MSSTTTTASLAWVNWFNSRESGTSINKKHQEKLFSTFNFEVSDSKCLDLILEHQETAFLYKANFGTSTVGILHHLVAAGGTIYDSVEKQFGFIQGVGKSTASKMTPEIDVLCKVKSENEVSIPTNSQLFGLSSVDQVDGLSTSSRNKFLPRNFIPIPPFLLSSVHEAIGKSNGDAKVVLTESVREIKKFDDDHNDDHEFVDKAKDKCKAFVFWLYLVSQNSDTIAATPTISVSNEKVASALDELSLSCLDSSPTVATAPSSLIDHVEQSLKRPFEVLAASSSSTSDFLEKLTQLQSQSQEKSSKSFKKIPIKYQNMILVACSVSEVTILEYDAEGAAFFKSSSVLNAQVLLNSLLEAESIDCSVSPALTSSLLLGSFLWKDSISPSGFASAVLSSESFIRSDTLHEGMILDYATKFDMSETSLTKLTKTQVVFPLDIEELTHRIRGFYVLSCCFFKKTGFISQGLKKLVNFCMDNKTVLRTRVYMDEKFIAKFICAIDDRIHQWLRQCSLSNSVTDTDISLVEFSSLISDVQLNRFQYILPPSVTKIVSSESRNQSLDKNSKRQKPPPSMIKNQNMNEDWKLRNTENWSTVFRNKTIGGPMLSKECRPCLKYHVKGICYDDCMQKASHCVLIEHDKIDTDNYIKQLRGE